MGFIKVSLKEQLALLMLVKITYSRPINLQTTIESLNTPNHEQENHHPKGRTVLSSDLH